jgi:hypothetical protein
MRMHKPTFAEVLLLLMQILGWMQCSYGITPLNTDGLLTSPG